MHKIYEDIIDAVKKTEARPARVVIDKFRLAVHDNNAEELVAVSPLLPELLDSIGLSVTLTPALQNMHAIYYEYNSLKLEKKYGNAEAYVKSWRLTDVTLCADAPNNDRNDVIFVLNTTITNIHDDQVKKTEFIIEDETMLMHTDFYVFVHTLFSKPN